jgi:carbonic anhydrase
MSEAKPRWLDIVLGENAKFRGRVRSDTLPVQRSPGTVAVVTCMDPRVNLEAVGIPGFTEQGEGRSSIRVIRSIGAGAEPRSLVIGIFLAGIREIAVVMHTDCGCCLAYARIGTIVENMHKTLTEAQLDDVKRQIGEPFRENLRAWLKAFEDPREAAQAEVASIRSLPFVPKDLVVHGLLYDLASGAIEVVVNGYRGEEVPAVRRG